MMTQLFADRLAEYEIPSLRFARSHPNRYDSADWDTYDQLIKRPYPDKTMGATL